MKVLVVTMEWPRASSGAVELISLDGNETSDELKQMAEDVFVNYTNYGYEIKEV